MGVTTPTSLLATLQGCAFTFPFPFRNHPHPCPSSPLPTANSSDYRLLRVSQTFWAASPDAPLGAERNEMLLSVRAHGVTQLLSSLFAQDLVTT